MVILRKFTTKKLIVHKYYPKSTSFCEKMNENLEKMNEYL